ncbi:MAG: biopolymer transporter ExbD [Candidatus Kapaibacterium sp.]
MKRVGVVMDMTPLVDVAFLLLTFFMFTAKFKSDVESEQKFDIQRPKASADTTKLPEKNTATVKVAIEGNDTTIWYALSNVSDRSPVYMIVPGTDATKASSMTQIQIPDTSTLGAMILQTRRQNSKYKFVVDADKRVNYGRIEQVMNTMRNQGATIFNFVTIKQS